MNWKKGMSITLSGILLSTAVAGCSTKTETGAAGGGDAAAQAVNAPPPKLKVAVVNNEGYVVASANINEDKYVQKMRELSKTDVKFELINSNEKEKQITLMFAGGDLPDLIQAVGINSAELAPAVDAGALTDLKPLLEKYGPNIMKNTPKEAWTGPEVYKDGKIYGIPLLNFNDQGRITLLRKDWLDKLGLQVPKTVDEFIEVLKAFRDKDPNGNGKKDEIPYTGREALLYAETFMNAYDVTPNTFKFENGQMVPGFIRPQMKQALELYKMMYQEKLLDNDVFLNKTKDTDTKIKGSGLVGMFVTGADGIDKLAADLKKNVPGAEIIPVAAPLGPDGKGGSFKRSIISATTWVIPSTNKNPENAIKFLDWFYTPEAQKLVLYGLEGVDHTVENGKISYKVPSTNEETTRESMHLNWMRFLGPSHVLNKEFMQLRPFGDLVMQAMEIATKEGRKNDAEGMPYLPAMQKNPDLYYKGLFIEFAAKVMTGKEPVENFDKFVEDFKKRGGDELIKEGTEWYNKNTK
ncbi:extracellular solute-binding protein [Paenibacillus agricola]|uniref:Extracellular solute-binding protein n=1 Tax=Paenibacillus agricola TaxID=2716264 RepID=A0ABX0JH99_9BACL|nr:extracellular solute-binding protein [Paenibacillus agricola]NHN35196.1 extracellular solute-binding protein [Paenibacillus agricola]